MVDSHCNPFRRGNIGVDKNKLHEVDQIMSTIIYHHGSEVIVHVIYIFVIDRRQLCCCRW